MEFQNVDSTVPKHYYVITSNSIPQFNGVYLHPTLYDLVIKRIEEPIAKEIMSVVDAYRDSMKKKEVNE
jgi:DNA-binding protein Fis